MLYGLAALVWTIVGDPMPGGRWLAIHLFTLGVVTNLVLVFTEHFGRTLTRVPAERVRWQMPVVNAAILLVLAGLPSDTRWATAVGATIVTGAVTAAYVRLRRMRKQALGARFVWIVRIYERAHGAFVHGAILGLLMGIRVLTGRWYGSGRIAHLHVNLAGWAGLTLLATLVFFGPTMARTRIRDGADDRAATALRRGTTGLTIAVLLLLATAVGGTAGTWLRVLASSAMATYAIAVVATCIPVARAVHGAKPSATRWPVVLASCWFVAIAWVDVAVIATGTWRWLDALGLAMVLGVLAQTITAVLTYLTPMLRARSFAGRDRLLARLERGATIRTVMFNVGVLAVTAAAAARGAPGAAVSRAGWGLVAASLVWLAVQSLRPARMAGRP